MYDGTITMPDPALVETWGDEIDGHTIYLRHDADAPNPREDHHHVAALVATLPQGYIEPDGRGDQRHDAVRDALVHYGYDMDLIARYLRIFHAAAAVEVTDAGGYRDVHMVIGWLTREDVERYGIADPAAFVRSELKEYAQWARGEVYGVTVVRNEDGAEASLWGVYDEHPFDYAKSVARDLVGEVE